MATTKKKAVPDNTRVIPVNILKGMFTSGDLSAMEDGYCIRIRNMLIRPNRLEARPPLVYDDLMTIRSLAIYDDQTNKVQRGLAINTTPNLFMKGTSGETWGSSLGSVGAANARLSDFANYRNVFYGMLDDGAGVPTSAFSFNGTTIDTTPFNSNIYGRCITSYLDRNFIAYPRVTTDVTNTFGIANTYDITAWNAAGVSNVNRRAQTDGTTTTYRATNSLLTTTANAVYIANRILAFPSAAADTKVVYRADYKPVHPSKSVDVMFVAAIAAGVTHSALTAYTVGQITLSNDIVWRVVTAGTSSAGPVALTAGSIGREITDGTVVWRGISSWILAAKAVTIPSAAEQQEWRTTFLDVTVPWSTNSPQIEFGMHYGNRPYTTSTYDLVDYFPIDLAYKDGLADGTIGKSNRGQQVTFGDHYFPFINTETATTSAKDLNSIIWSDVLLPKSIRASATYELPQVPGFPTAAIILGGRYIVFKRGAFWIFIGNQDVDTLDAIPIRREREYLSVGCIGPRALDSVDDDLYFLGENGFYRFNIGMDDPEELGGDAMREEIMARGSNWVESQATYNMPIVEINKRDKEVYVYTQKGTVYVYNIQNKGWTTWDTADGAEIADMRFNPTTQKMYIAVGAQGLSRLDWTVSPATDTVESTLASFTVIKDIVTRPLESDADLFEATLQSVGFKHLASTVQTSQTLTGSFSTDRGASYSFSTAAGTVNIAKFKNRVSFFQYGDSFTVKISHSGKAGATIWGVSKLDAEIVLHGGEWPEAWTA